MPFFVMRYILTTLLSLALCAALPCPAQTLPTLPPDPNIQTGVLPNGVTYYIASNSTGTGLVDIALVQKVGKADETGHQGETTVQVRGTTADLPHFSTYSPFRYMAGNYIWPGVDGYAKVNDDATIYRFPNLSQAVHREIVDSTLLMVFDMIARNEGPLADAYSPLNQAVVVAGDMNATGVLSKMNMLSMLVTKTPAKVIPRPYEWHDEPNAHFRAISSDTPGISTLSVEYRSPRTPKENINTVLPLVSQRYYSELGTIVRKRAEKLFRDEGVPVASISSDYRSSDHGPGDERFSISLTVPDEMAVLSSELLASILADIDTHGVSKDEYADAAAEVLMGMKERSFTSQITNESYVSTCIASFLYGTSLASSSTMLNFFIKRNMDGEVASGLFNKFASAVLDQSRNLLISCRSAAAETMKDGIMVAFGAPWYENERSWASYHSPAIDTIAIKPSSAKSKIKTTAPEPVSGGQIWTFDNGIRVAFKKSATAGSLFQYTWVLKGGYSQMQTLSRGEGAYFSDMFSLLDVSGISCVDFRNMLSANAISMQGQVSLSDFHIRGMAPLSRLALLLKSLSAMANARSLNPEALEYYKKCEDLRLRALAGTPEEERLMLDSVLSPGGEYTTLKRPLEFSASFKDNVSRYFEKEFSKMNDGILLIVGNFDEANIKKLLAKYIGTFPTSNATSLRGKLRSTNITSRSTESRVGEASALNLALSTPLNQTAENYMAGVIAATVLKDNVSKAVAKYGWTVQSSSNFTMFPQEAFNVDFRITRACDDGLPASMAPSDSVDLVLDVVRKAILRTGQKGVSAENISAGKATLTKIFDRWNSEPYLVLTMMEMRYAYSKDLMMNYKSRIAALAGSSVNTILSLLSQGGQAEFIVRSKYPTGLITEAVQQQPELPVVPEMVPASDFTYPFAGMRVPLEGVDIKTLRKLPRYYFDPDSAMTIVRKKVLPPEPDSLGVKAVMDSIAVAVDSLTEQLADSARVAIERLLLSTPADSLAVGQRDSLAVGTDSLRMKKDSVAVDSLHHSMPPSRVLPRRPRVDSVRTNHSTFNTGSLKAL